MCMVPTEPRQYTLSLAEEMMSWFLWKQLILQCLESQNKHYLKITILFFMPHYPEALFLSSHMRYYAQ